MRNDDAVNEETEEEVDFPDPPKRPLEGHLKALIYAAFEQIEVDIDYEQGFFVSPHRPFGNSGTNAIADVLGFLPGYDFPRQDGNMLVDIPENKMTAWRLYVLKLWRMIPGFLADCVIISPAEKEELRDTPAGRNLLRDLGAEDR